MAFIDVVHLFGGLTGVSGLRVEPNPTPDSPGPGFQGPWWQYFPGCAVEAFLWLAPQSCPGS